MGIPTQVSGPRRQAEKSFGVDKCECQCNAVLVTVSGTVPTTFRRSNLNSSLRCTQGVNPPGAGLTSKIQMTSQCKSLGTSLPCDPPNGIQGCAYRAVDVLNQSVTVFPEYHDINRLSSNNLASMQRSAAGCRISN